VNIASLGFSAVMPEALYLMQKFIIIEIVFLGVFSFAFGESNAIIATAIRKLIVIGFYIYLVSNFDTLSTYLFQSFGKIGILAGGSGITIDDIFNPSGIMEMGFECVQSVLDTIGGAWEAILNPIETLFKGLIIIAILIAYFIIALTDFMIITEFIIFTVSAVILLPFGIFRPTAFLAESAIGAAFKLGFKFLVFSFVLCMSFNILQNLNLPDDPTLYELFDAFFTSATIAWLSSKVPQMASNIISGSPGLSGPTVSQVVVGGATTVAGGAYIGKKISNKISTISKTSALKRAAERKSKASWPRGGFTAS